MCILKNKSLFVNFAKEWRELKALMQRHLVVNQFYEVSSCWFSLYIVHLVSRKHDHRLPAVSYVRIGNVNCALITPKIKQTLIQDHKSTFLPLVWHQNYCCVKCILARFKYTLIYCAEYLTMWTVALGANQVSFLSRGYNILAASCRFYSSRSYSEGIPAEITRLTIKSLVTKHIVLCLCVARRTFKPAEVNH